MKPELRYAAAEFRQAQDGEGGGPGVVAGTVVRYGDVAILPFGRERIVAGAFAPLPKDGVRANVQHERARPLAVLGRGLILEDSASALRAAVVLPDTSEGRDTAELYRQGVLAGMSVEMAVLQERRAGDVREVLKAVITGIGLIDVPAYPSSTAAVRHAVATPRPDWARRPDWW